MRSEVWLYGSVARQTHTAHSDLDILVIPRDEVPKSLDALTANLPQREFLSVTTYSWHEVDRMASYGSLFLVHLAREGQLLEARGQGAGLSGVLSALPRYTRYPRELAGFSMALDDGLESIRDGGDLRFEIGIVGRVPRHASILACYLEGEPRFDRRTALSVAFDAMGMGQANLEHALAVTEEIRRRDAAPYLDLPERSEVTYMFEMAQTFVRRVVAAHGAA